MRSSKRKSKEHSGGPSDKKSKWEDIDLSIPTRVKKGSNKKRHGAKISSEESQLLYKKKKALHEKNYRHRGIDDHSNEFSVPRIERIRTALEGLSSGKYKTISEAACTNGVHYDQIQRRAAGKVKWYRRNGPEPYLTLGEEQQLSCWVTTMVNKGFPVTPKQLKESVQKMITQESGKSLFRNGRPSNSWYRGFLSRHPEIKPKLSIQSLSMAGTEVTNEASAGKMRPSKRKSKEDSEGPSRKKSKWTNIDLSIPTRVKKGSYKKREVAFKTSHSQERQLSHREKRALLSKSYRNRGIIVDDLSRVPATQNERIRTAMEGLLSGKYKTISEAASVNGVHYDQIQRRAKGKVKWYSRNGPEPYLTLPEEQQLSRWVITMGNRGFPVTSEQLKDTVQEMVILEGRKTPFRDGRPSDGWLRSFLKRNPEIHPKLARKSLDIAGAKVTKEAIDDWFSNFKCYISDLNLSDKPRQIYNFGETVFGLGDKSPWYSLGSPHTKGAPPQVTCGEGQKAVTVGICANADGKLLPPYFLFEGTKPNSFDILAGAPSKSIACFTASGQMTEIAFQHWFENHFLQNIGEERPVVLLLPSDVGCIAYDLFHAAEQSNIHLYRFLSNATHISLPLDVGVFEPMKKSCREHLRRWKARNPGGTGTQKTFSGIIGSIWEDLERPSVIRKGFASSGIFTMDGAATTTEEMTMPSSTSGEDESDEESTADESSLEKDTPKTPDAQRTVSAHLAKATAFPSVRMKKKSRRRLALTTINTVEELLRKCRSKAEKELAAKKKHSQKNGTGCPLQTSESQECRCPICGGRYDDSVMDGWVGCDSCYEWYHISCMPDDIVTDKMLKRKKWFCTNCCS